MKNIIIGIEKLGEVVVDTKLCELSFVRRRDKQFQMILADLQPMSIDNIQLNLKQKINIKGEWVTECSLLPDVRLLFSYYDNETVRFINKNGVELFQIGKAKTECATFDTVHIKDNNSVAVSSGCGDNICITIIDKESQEVMTTISMDTDIYAWLLEVEQCITVQVVMD